MSILMNYVVFIDIKVKSSLCTPYIARSTLCDPQRNNKLITRSLFVPSNYGVTTLYGDIT